MMHDWLTWLAGDRARDLASRAFAFSLPLPPLVVFALIAALAAAAWAWYWPELRGQSRRVRLTLAALRTGAVALALFLLFDPCVVGVRVEPGEQTVIFLVDDSQSMNVRDEYGRSRIDRLHLNDPVSFNRFQELLRQRFLVSSYRFGAAPAPLNSLDELQFNQSRSDIAGAIQTALNEQRSSRVAAVVLLSDGVQQSSRETNVDFGSLAAPVYVIDPGAESGWKDLRIANLSVSRTHFDKSPVSVAVDVSAQGLAGRAFRVDLMRGGLAVDSKTLEVPEADWTGQARFEFVPVEKDWLQYDVRASLVNESVEEGTEAPRRSIENILENNVRSFIVDNRDREYRILFYSGRPNWEHKFIRRALNGDEQLKLASLILISRAQKKFVFRGARATTANPLYDGFKENDELERYDEPVYLRLGVKQDELVNGYPDDASELFPYDLVIWNDFDAGDFTLKQMELTRDFVDKRGGSFLWIGDAESLRRENLTGSPIEPMMPLALLNPASDAAAPRGFVQVKPTWEGEFSGVWTLKPGENGEGASWLLLPPLFARPPYAMTRAGAEVMAKSDSGGGAFDERPFFVTQHYGQGTSAMLTAPETWPWRMKENEDDETHEQLWRRIVRDLVDAVPRQIELRELKDEYPAREPIAFEALVRDGLFDAREGLRTRFTVTAPSGAEYPLGVEESLRESGVYRAEFTPDETGLYALKVESASGEQTVSQNEFAFLAENNRDELLNPRLDPEFVQRIADRSGGELWPAERWLDLPERIPWKPDEESEAVRVHLWHNPFFFGLLVLLMPLEWFIRRKYGEA